MSDSVIFGAMALIFMIFLMAVLIIALVAEK